MVHLLQSWAMDLWSPGGSANYSMVVATAVRCRISCEMCSRSRGDGSVVAWGNQSFGGCSSAVQAQLKHVQQIIQASYCAFAAILSDGSVVT